MSATDVTNPPADAGLGGVSEASPPRATSEESVADPFEYQGGPELDYSEVYADEFAMHERWGDDLPRLGWEP